MTDMLWWSEKKGLKNLEERVCQAVGYFVQKYQQVPVRVLMNPAELQATTVLSVNVAGRLVTVTLLPRRVVMAQHLVVSTVAGEQLPFGSAEAAEQVKLPFGSPGGKREVER